MFVVFRPDSSASLAPLAPVYDFLRLIQFLEWSGFDRDRFEAIVERTGLVAKWQQFKRLYVDEA